MRPKRINSSLLVATLVAAASCAFCLLDTATTAAPLKKEAGFGAVIKLVEAHYRAKHTSIPVLARFGIATAKTTAKLVSPTARKYLRLGDFKLAVFEDQEFSASANEFHRRMRETLEPDWHSLVVVRAPDEAQTFTYTKEDGDKFKVLIVVIEGRDGVVVQVDLKPQEFFKLLQNPEDESRAIADEAATTEPE